MATCNPTELLAAGKCFDCLDEGLKQTIKLQLLCEIANGGGATGITSLTGDVTATGPGAAAATIAARAVTFAKLQAISTSRVLGRLTAGSGDVEELTITGTGNVVFSASPTLTGTALAGGVTMSGRLINSANGALSAPAFSVTGTPITGGTATTTKPLALIETAGATSTGWPVNGTMLGINAPAGFSPNGFLIDAQVNGVGYFYVSSGGTRVKNSALTVDGNILVGASSQISWNSGDLVIRRAAAANLALGAADAASPIGQTISVQNVAPGTTDTAGATTTIDLSRGTGTGSGGGLLVRGAISGASGSTQNPLATWARVLGNGAGSALAVGSTTSSYISPFSSKTLTSVLAGTGMSFVNTQSSTTDEYSFWFTGNSRTPTSGDVAFLNVSQSFAPTSGTATYSQFRIAPTINQTGGASGITRALYINPTLTAAADFRALEISDGNMVLPKTVTAGGTTGNQTINKLTGSVNFAAAATSLTVTNSYVTTSSIITATVATNDATMKSVLVVASAGSFVIHANAAATAETRVNWKVTN